MARFEKGQLDALRALSRETGAPVAYFIRLAVKQFLESRVANVEPPK